jgi:hypothetical protein
MIVYFCLPGFTYSGVFLRNFVQTVFECKKAGIHVKVSQSMVPGLHYARNQVLLQQPVTQDVAHETLPFQGEEYDHMIWIDSDIRFTSKDVFNLLDDAERLDADAISGLYKQAENEWVAGWHGKDFEEVESNNHDKYFRRLRFISDQDLEGLDKPFEIDFCGFGFVVVRKGVMESIGYPWFRSTYLVVNSGKTHMQAGEDLLWCIMARHLGYKILCDPAIRVGHEKMRVL